MTMDYSYLADLEGQVDEESLLVSANFAVIKMGHTSQVKIDGVVCERDKFSAEGFPEQNLESFYLIPLYVNPIRRMMYKQGYTGDSNPPDCQSNDGLRPVTPLMLNGAPITSCNACPLFGYSKDFRCRNKGALIGLAYFPEHDHLIVPVRKDIPGLSIKALSGLATKLSARAIVAETGEKKPMKIHSRIVKATIAYNDSGKFTGIPGWAFTLLDAQSKDPAIPHGFVPPDLVPEVAKFTGLAKAFARVDSYTTPQLPTQGVAGSISGGTEVYAAREEAYAQTLDMNPSMTTVSKDAESDY